MTSPMGDRPSTPWTAPLAQLDVRAGFRFPGCLRRIRGRCRGLITHQNGRRPALVGATTSSRPSIPTGRPAMKAADRRLNA